MSDDSDIADDKSAAAVLGQADAHRCATENCGRRATCLVQGAYLCDRCEQAEPAWMRRTYLAVLLAVLCLPGCLSRPEPAPDATIAVSMATYEALLRQAYLDAADKLDAGDWTTDRAYRDGFAELHVAARRHAMQALADREQAETGGEQWTAEKQAAYCRTIAGEGAR